MILNINRKYAELYYYELKEYNSKKPLPTKAFPNEEELEQEKLEREQFLEDFIKIHNLTKKDIQDMLNAFAYTYFNDYEFNYLRNKLSEEN